MNLGFAQYQLKPPTEYEIFGGMYTAGHIKKLIAE